MNSHGNVDIHIACLYNWESWYIVCWRTESEYNQVSTDLCQKYSTFDFLDFLIMLVLWKNGVKDEYKITTITNAF